MATFPIGGPAGAVTYNGPSDQPTDCSLANNPPNVLLAALHACEAAGIAHSTFGRRAVGDPRFIYDLRNGRVLRPSTQAKVIAFLTTICAEPLQMSKSNVARPKHTRRVSPSLLGHQYREMMHLGSERLRAAIQRERGEG